MEDGCHPPSDCHKHNHHRHHRRPHHHHRHHHMRTPHSGHNENNGVVFWKQAHNHDNWYHRRSHRGRGRGSGRGFSYIHRPHHGWHGHNDDVTGFDQPITPSPIHPEIEDINTSTPSEPILTPRRSRGSMPRARDWNWRKN